MTAPGKDTENQRRLRLRLRLYVAGDALNSIGAIANLRAAIAECAGGEADIEIIDVLRDPDRGLRDGILVTPMLVKIEPLPERRLLGSLRDRQILLAVLGLEAPHE